MGCWYAFALYYQDRRSGQCKISANYERGYADEESMGTPSACISKGHAERGDKCSGWFSR